MSQQRWGAPASPRKQQSGQLMSSWNAPRMELAEDTVGEGSLNSCQPNLGISNSVLHAEVEKESPWDSHCHLHGGL
jgi:hypothetical protein